MTSRRAPTAAAPAAPRRPASDTPRPLDATALDPEYPDVDEVDLDGDHLSVPEARTLSVLASRLVGVVLDLPADCTVDGVDAVFVDVDLAGRVLAGGWRRTRFERCRLTGADFGTARLEDVAFVDCALDLSSFRAATLERVLVDGGTIDDADLTGARLTDVTVARLPLPSSALGATRNTRVDLRLADLRAVRDIDGLRGCIVTEVQAIALAPHLARAHGLTVAEPAEG